MNTKYARIEISFLNGGHGRIVRTVSRHDLEWLWKKFAWGDCPNRGTGATGNGVLNFAWKIYERPTSSGDSLSSRLFSYKLGKHLRNFSVGLYDPETNRCTVPCGICKEAI